MPAYSFQQHFVPYVADGSKPHTIRQRRKKGFAKKGDTVYLYSGLRTKWCKKIREEVCTRSVTIIITSTDIYICSFRLSDQQVQEVMDELNSGKNIDWLASPLSKQQRNRLAWRDGFRYEPTGINSIGNFEMMIRWWRKTHELPFIGDIIYWKMKNK